MEYLLSSSEYISYRVFTLLHDCAGKLDDLTRRSIVGIEYDQLGIWIEIVEYPDIAGIGSLELVDGLIIITDGEYVRTLDTLTHDARDEPELCIVGILVLIDHDPLILFCQSCPDGVISLGQSYGSQYHI